MVRCPRLVIARADVLALRLPVHVLQKRGTRMAGLLIVEELRGELLKIGQRRAGELALLTCGRRHDICRVAVRVWALPWPAGGGEEGVILRRLVLQVPLIALLVHGIAVSAKLVGDRRNRSGEFLRPA